jgi:threonine dehydrogenase-like Zn-dependent dehydrogenase
MAFNETISKSFPDSSQEHLRRNTQLALRFRPLLGLLELPVDTRFLQLPYALTILKKIAGEKGFVRLDSEAPTPNPEVIQEFGLTLNEAEACRICGSDKALMYLVLALSNLSDLPDVQENSRMLQIQDALFQTIARLSSLSPNFDHLQKKGKPIFAHTMGHEILVPGGAVYAPTHILNNERIRGLALGFGAIIVDEQEQLLSELPGGFCKRIAVHPEKQIIKHDLPLEIASGIDARACVKRAFEEIIGDGMPISPSLNSDIPTVIIGFGTLGLTAADELNQKGFDMSKVAVVAKYPIQEKAATELGCQVVNVRDPEHIEQLARMLNTKVKRSGSEFWFEEGAPLVIDAVGSLQSIDLSSHIIRNGYLIELGLPQEMKVDLNRFSMNNSQLVFRRWAQPWHYKDAINALSKTTFPGWKQVTKIVSLSNIYEGLKPSQEDKQKYNNFVATPSTQLTN